VQVRRWFTLYFIPLIPLQVAGRYIECKGCSATFDESVRSYDPEAANRKFRATFEPAMLRAMAAMAAADGVIDDRELETIALIMTKISGNGVEIDEVKAVIGPDLSKKLSLEQILRDVSGSLSDDGKAMVLHALMLVASADGTVAPEEREALTRAGKVLGLRRNDVDRLLAA
jgi:uncharacterized membrane protein YebE (DUF533 family)